MPVTREFRETIMKRAAHDKKFRKALLKEAIDEMLSGDFEAGKAILRDFINATITFTTLAKEMKKSSKSIHRMLGPSGNPRADSMLGIIKKLQEHEHVRLCAEVKRATAVSCKR